MGKKIIKLTENDLKQIIKESVNNIINKNFPIRNKALRESNKIYYYKDINNGFDGDIEKQKEYSWDQFEDRDWVWGDYLDEDNLDDNCDNFDDCVMQARLKRLKDNETKSAFDDRFGSKDWDFKANNGIGAKRALDDLAYLNDGRGKCNLEYWRQYSDRNKAGIDMERDFKASSMNRRKASQERRKTKNALKAADSRPLHRKGSLNRFVPN